MGTECNKVKIKSAVTMVEVRGEETLFLTQGPREERVSKEKRLVRILFLLNFNQRILESPTCCAMVEPISWEKIKKWVTQRVEAQTPSMADVTSDSELLSLTFKHN